MYADTTGSSFPLTGLVDNIQPLEMTPSEKLAVMKLAFMTLLVNVKTMRDQLPIETGVCCCGAPMEGHGPYENHAPRDEGEYFVTSAIEQAEKAFKELCT